MLSPQPGVGTDDSSRTEPVAAVTDSILDAVSSSVPHTDLMPREPYPRTPARRSSRMVSPEDNDVASLHELRFVGDPSADMARDAVSAIQSSRQLAIWARGLTTALDTSIGAIEHLRGAPLPGRDREAAWVDRVHDPAIRALRGLRNAVECEQAEQFELLKLIQADIVQALESPSISEIARDRFSEACSLYRGDVPGQVVPPCPFGPADLVFVHVRSVVSGVIAWLLTTNMYAGAAAFTATLVFDLGGIGKKIEVDWCRAFATAKRAHAGADVECIETLDRSAYLLDRLLYHAQWDR